jgi:hypothetical protein
MDLDVNWTTVVDIDDEHDTRITLNETFKRRESLSLYTPSYPSDDSNRINRNRYERDEYFNDKIF